jgi:hypothetical protein
MVMLQTKKLVPDGFVMLSSSSSGLFGFLLLNFYLGGKVWC